MSKYVECELEFKDIDCLIEALLTVDHPATGKPWTERQIKVHLDSEQEGDAERLKEKYPGLQVHTNGPQPLMGYEGRARKERANVIIPKRFVQGMANDIGFTVSKDGESKAIISQFDGKLFGAKWQNGVKQEYGLAVAKKTCREHGWKFSEERTPEGQIRLNVKGL